MSVPFVDTDVIVRYVAGDDPRKQAAAALLFQAVEDGRFTLAAPASVIADAVFVLASTRLYRVSRAVIRDGLGVLVRLPHFRIDSKEVLLHALDLYADLGLDFGDAMIVAEMLRTGARRLYSYDRGFDRVPGLERIEP